ncbi:hypothetical protein BDS110ZK25_67020 [Bradyrhizobium diazoefficiens]|nr:hypothetical protein BJA01nite_70300 [Bradyrhizobium japonicum]
MDGVSFHVFSIPKAAGLKIICSSYASRCDAIWITAEPCQYTLDFLVRTRHEQFVLHQMGLRASTLLGEPRKTQNQIGE